jgi:hypothetical protein
LAAAELVEEAPDRDPYKFGFGYMALSGNECESIGLVLAKVDH